MLRRGTCRDLLLEFRARRALPTLPADFFAALDASSMTVDGDLVCRLYSECDTIVRTARNSFCDFEVDDAWTVPPVSRPAGLHARLGCLRTFRTASGAAVRVLRRGIAACESAIRRLLGRRGRGAPKCSDPGGVEAIRASRRPRWWRVWAGA